MWRNSRYRGTGIQRTDGKLYFNFQLWQAKDPYLGVVEGLTVLPLLYSDIRWGASQVALVVKNPPSNAGDVTDAGLMPGSGITPGEENGNPLQYFCLENLMDKGAWWATVYGVSVSRTRLKRQHTRMQKVR